MPQDLAPVMDTCPLCGHDVISAHLMREGGVRWGAHHHVHALCALENLAVRVAELERTLAQHKGEG